VEVIELLGPVGLQGIICESLTRGAEKFYRWLVYFRKAEVTDVIIQSSIEWFMYNVASVEPWHPVISWATTVDHSH
jgi:hypothetical protein